MELRLDSKGRRRSVPRSIARVSTADQFCEWQERDLAALPSAPATRSWAPTRRPPPGSGLDRAERKRVLALAQRREIEAVLVTELSRWGVAPPICWPPCAS